jgi:hypothetical protein
MEGLLEKLKKARLRDLKEKKDIKPLEEFDMGPNRKLDEYFK